MYNILMNLGKRSYLFVTPNVTGTHAAVWFNVNKAEIFLQTGSHKHLHYSIPQDPHDNCLYHINIPSLNQFYLLITLPNTRNFNSWKKRGMRTTNLRWRNKWCWIQRWFVWWWIHRSSAETRRSVPVWCPPLQEQPYTCTSTNVCQLLNVLILAKKSRRIHYSQYMY